MPRNDELSEEFKTFTELEKLRDQVAVATELLMRCLPYIERHYDLSRPTFGQGAKAIKDEIARFLSP